MKIKNIIPTTAAVLFGLLFITFGANYFFPFLPTGGGAAAGSPPALFFGAMAGTGYMAFIKICEILGGILVAIPKTRNLGLLILGPIVINIFAIKFLMFGRAATLDVKILGICGLAALLLWTGRKEFQQLIRTSRVK